MTYIANIVLNRNKTYIKKELGYADKYSEKYAKKYTTRH